MPPPCEPHFRPRPIAQSRGHFAGLGTDPSRGPTSNSPTADCAPILLKYIDMPRDEVKRRDARHSRQETERMQQAGLLPDDAWIEANDPGPQL